MTETSAPPVSIVEFLEARLSEEQAIAEAAPGGEWTACTEDSIAGASVYDEQWVLLYPMHYDHDNALSNQPGATGPMYIERSRDELAAHIARHDPARVLAEIAAKRKVLEFWAIWNEPDSDGHLRADTWAQATRHAIKIVMYQLALIHSDHPDYDERWRP